MIVRVVFVAVMLAVMVLGLDLGLAMRTEALLASRSAGRFRRRVLVMFVVHTG